MFWKILYIISITGFFLTLLGLWVVRSSVTPTSVVWEIEAYKVEAPGSIVALKPNEEIISYDRDAQVVYVKRKKEVTDND
jgi:hypothetical protein